MPASVEVPLIFDKQQAVTSPIQAPSFKYPFMCQPGRFVSCASPSHSKPTTCSQPLIQRQRCLRRRFVRQHLQSRPQRLLHEPTGHPSDICPLFLVVFIGALPLDPLSPSSCIDSCSTRKLLSWDSRNTIRPRSCRDQLHNSSPERRRFRCLRA